MLLSVFIPRREKNQDQRVNEMSGEESAKHVKMPQKILFPEEKESKVHQKWHMAGNHY